MLVYNSLILLSINQSITCILIIAVTLRNLLSSNKVEKEIKRKLYTSNKNLQNKINYYNKHIVDAIGLMVKLRREVF